MCLISDEYQHLPHGAVVLHVPQHEHVRRNRWNATGYHGYVLVTETFWMCSVSVWNGFQISNNVHVRTFWGNETVHNQRLWFQLCFLWLCIYQLTYRLLTNILFIIFFKDCTTNVVQSCCCLLNMRTENSGVHSPHVARYNPMCKGGPIST